jgi:hypothetical protein
VSRKPRAGRALCWIGAELVAAPETGEVATQFKGSANISNGVRTSDTVAPTIHDIGIPSQHAHERRPGLSEMGF